MVLVSWTSMRGIVSLATALALPLVLNDGSPFPYRTEIILITMVVILMTLVAQGLTLEPIIRAFNFAPEHAHIDEERLARREALRRGAEALDDLSREPWADARDVEWLRADARDKMAMHEHHRGGTQGRRRLRAGMIAAERTCCSDLRLTLTVCLISVLVGQLSLFASVFAFRELKFEAQMAAGLWMCTSIARLTLSPAAGWLTDRWGAKNSLLLWPALSALAFFPLAIFPGKISVFAATALAAVAWSGFSGAMNALTCGIPKPEHRAGHFTLLGFCLIAANSAGPVLVGWMFDRMPYRSGFLVLGSVALAVTALGSLLLRGLSSKAEDFH